MDNQTQLSDEKLLEMYRLLVLARRFDEYVMQHYAAGDIPGFMHLYIGEEAVAVGACSALKNDDYITSTHRGHGHCVSKGGDPKLMMAELFAKAAGYCKGKGGSMHIANLSLGILGANGIVAGGIPIAAGAGLSSSMLGNGRVTVCFFGDGASNEGAFHEAANLASVWKLPVVFLCENNCFAQTTPQCDHQAICDVVSRAEAYCMPFSIADGMDVLDVHSKVMEAVERARSGGGPSLVECKTYRYRGHWEGDPQVYRTQDDINLWKQRDCIESFGKYLLESEKCDQASLDKIKADVEEQMQNAVAYARACEPPKPEDVLTDVYTPAKPARRSLIKVEPKDSATIREAINSTLDAIMATDDKALIFGEDIALHGGAFSVTKGLFEKYGKERVRNTPISEGAIIGAAIGAAATGLRPIPEIMFCDFFYVAMDQIVNQMAKMKYMYGGDAQLPIVVRCTCGGGFAAAAQHSQSNEAMFMHVPGLRVLVPSTPDDAAGLLISAFEDPNPVLFFEHKGMYDEKGPITGKPIPIGKAKKVREGTDITVLTYGKMRKLCEQIAKRFAADGISLEVIDLRSLLPLDEETMVESVMKTGRAVIVHEAPLTAGPGAEIAAIISERAFGYLKAPVRRIAGLDVPMPFAPILEKEAIPSPERIAAGIREALA